MESTGVILLCCSVQCFLLVMLLESRVRILAMLFAAAGFLIFLTGLAWPLMIDGQSIGWMDRIAHSLITRFGLLSALLISVYLVRNFPPPDLSAMSDRGKPYHL